MVFFQFLVIQLFQDTLQSKVSQYDFQMVHQVTAYGSASTPPQLTGPQFNTQIITVTSEFVSDLSTEASAMVIIKIIQE